MTEDKARKSAIRDRMAQTGEPYSVARRALDVVPADPATWTKIGEASDPAEVRGLLDIRNSRVPTQIRVERDGPGPFPHAPGPDDDWTHRYAILNNAVFHDGTDHLPVRW